MIRADASTEIGSGHIMRCLTLSDSLSRTGAHIKFICRTSPGNLIQKITSSGYEVIPLPETIPYGSEADFLQRTLAGLPPADWFIVDHYALDKKWEVSFAPYYKKCMVIDDMQDRSHHCHLLLNQNILRAENSYWGLIPDFCQALIGPEYALLRSEFAEHRETLNRNFEHPRNILISMGGSDTFNVTLLILESLSSLSNCDIEVKVIAGVQYPFYDDLISRDFPFNVSIGRNTDDMAVLMVWAHLSIGGGGTTSWERCCLGLPGIAIVIADNQLNIARALDEEGCFRNLGWYEDLHKWDIRNAVADLLGSPATLGEMSRNGMHLVDGRGASRVSQIVLNFPL
jgi:UDP-2,4-diacetamido-2,4,6-trideoxy-beta-L-altropyranose hydrolase